MELQKEHYDALKYGYDQEEVRQKELIERGKIFLSVLTIYVGILTLKVDDLQIVVKESPWSLTFLGFTSAFIISSLLLTILSLGIFTYEEPFILEEALTEAVGTDSLSEFYIDRLTDFAVGAGRNSKVNDKRGLLLAWASYFLVGGVATHLMAFYIYLQKPF